MSLADYDGLKASIASHLDRDDLTDQIPDFITLAESRHQREIRIRQMLTRTPITIDDRTIAIPDDFLDPKFLRIEVPNATAGRKYFPDVEEKSIYELTRISVAGARRPIAYAVTDVIEFDSEPDQDYGGELIYFAPLDALSGDQATNALLTRAPDAYLYAALAASAPFLVNDERIAVWEGLYSGARDAINAVDRRRSGPLIARVAGSTP